MGKRPARGACHILLACLDRFLRLTHRRQRYCAPIWSVERTCVVSEAAFAARSVRSGSY